MGELRDYISPICTVLLESRLKTGTRSCVLKLTPSSVEGVTRGYKIVYPFVSVAKVSKFKAECPCRY